MVTAVIHVVASFHGRVRGGFPSRILPFQCTHGDAMCYSSKHYVYALCYYTTMEICLHSGKVPMGTLASLCYCRTFQLALFEAGMVWWQVETLPYINSSLCRAAATQMPSQAPFRCHYFVWAVRHEACQVTSISWLKGPWVLPIAQHGRVKSLIRNYLESYADYQCL